MTPLALAAARRADSGTWSLRVACPLCGTLHTHGGSDGPRPLGGHRLAHCVDAPHGSGYMLVPTQSRWHSALIDDLAWLADRVRRPTTDTFKARARTSLVGVVEDNRGLPGYLRLVDRAGGAAFGLNDADVLVDALGPVAGAIRASAVAHRADGHSLLYTDACAPRLGRRHAEAYVERLRYVLAAAAVAEAAR